MVLVGNKQDSESERKVQFPDTKQLTDSLKLIISYRIK